MNHDYKQLYSSLLRYSDHYKVIDNRLYVCAIDNTEWVLSSYNPLFKGQLQSGRDNAD